MKHSYWNENVRGRYVIVRVQEKTFEYYNDDHRKAAEWSNEMVYFVDPFMPRPFDEPVFVDSDAQRVYVGLSQIQKLLAPKNVEKCIICLEGSLTHALIPCGHHCLCGTCAQYSLDDCPLCRAPIQGLLRIY